MPTPSLLHAPKLLFLVLPEVEDLLLLSLHALLRKHATMLPCHEVTGEQRCQRPQCRDAPAPDPNGDLNEAGDPHYTMTCRGTGGNGTHRMASSRNRAQPTQQMIQLARRQSCCTGERVRCQPFVVVNLCP